MRVVKIGIIGCGVISNRYIKDIKKFYQWLKIEACADAEPERAKAMKEAHEIPHAYEVEELLHNTEIEIIINLTPPGMHTELNKRILMSGKHVFCEKPFALTLEEAKEVVALANRQGLMVGSAPDTFMGSGLQTCRKLIDDGWIGTPLYATANMTSWGVEMWHPTPQNFYKRGAGPLFDMGPYYLTALVALMGPIDKVGAFAGTGFQTRRIYSQPLAGEELNVETPTHYSSILHLQSGVIVSMNMSFDIWHSNLPMLEIYGTEGTMILPDPNMSGGSPSIYRRERTTDTVYNQERSQDKLQQCVQIPELYPHISDYCRGAGVLDLAFSIVSGKKNRANAEIACHITEAMEGIMNAAETNSIYSMQTSCTRPESIMVGSPVGEL